MRKPYLNINSSLGLLKAAELGAGISFLGKEFIQDHDSELVDVFPSDKGQKIDMYYIFRKSMKSFKRIVSLGNFLYERHKHR
ncbi:MAG: hypothetical protein GY915_06260 [bacterium]|nr:hypothetical protein [bacterium]